MKALRRGAALAGAAALLYLALWPVPIAPVAWQAPEAPKLEGALAPNERLADVTRLAAGAVPGPESTAVDAQGRVLAGTRDGRIVRVDPASGRVETLANTGGRPLDLKFDAAGRLLVCDAAKGLLALDATGHVTTLATEHAGVRFGFVNGVDVAPDGTVFFSDTSDRRSIGAVREEVLEHGGRGRLYAFHPGTGAIELLAKGLEFANGVAVGPDGAYVLVNETGTYRIARHWLAGPKKGTTDLFAENLPGLPDNLTWSPARRAFWVALYSPRVPALDAMAAHPFLRKVALRLPLALQPQPAHVAWALALDESGRIVESLRHGAREAYAPVTSVLEDRGTLWLGSLEENAIGRIAAPPLPPGAR